MIAFSFVPHDRPLVVLLLLLAAGAALVEAGRRLVASHDSPTPDPRQTGTRSDLLARSPDGNIDPDTVRWLAGAVRSLAARPIWEGELIGHPLVARLVDDWLDVDFSDADPMAAPVPWLDVAAGRCWRLMRSTPLGRMPASDIDLPMPALVPIGPGLLVNLEGIGLLTVDGADEPAMDVVRSIVAELVKASPGRVEIRSTFAVTGIGTKGVVRRQSPSDLMTELPAWLDEVERSLETRSSCTAYSHRLATSDPTTPVVIITDPVGARDMPTLLEAAGQRRLPIAVVIVAGSAERGEAAIVLDPTGTAVLEPWGIDFTPQVRSAAAGRRLAEMVDVAGPRRRSRRRMRRPPLPVHRRPIGERPEARPVGKPLAVAIGPEPADWPTGAVALEPRSEELPSADPAREALSVEGLSLEGLALEGLSPEGLALEEDGVVAQVPDGSTLEPVEKPLAAPPGPEISVLGRVEMTGIDADLTSQQLSLLTYVACHPDATREAIIDALWDGRVISKRRFPNLLAETRSRVGRDLFPEASGGRYRLAGVSTDLERLERAIEDAADAGPGDRRLALRAAVGLIRGVPFTPPATRFWSWVTNHGHVAARIESTIADTTSRLAQLEQDAGDLDRARWACEKGLLASPADPTLVTILTEVYMELGKPALASRLVESWEERIGRLDCGAPSDEPRKRLAVGTPGCAPIAEAASGRSNARRG
jgi:hypothetical protein